MNIVSCWVCPTCGSIDLPLITLLMDASLSTSIVDGELVSCGALTPIGYRTSIIVCSKCNMVVDAPVYNPLLYKAISATRFYLEVIDNNRFKVMCLIHKGDEVDGK